MAQPPEESEPRSGSDPGAASDPLESYGRAPDPSGAYPSPDEGGFAPLPDLVPDERAAPGPGYGAVAGEQSTGRPAGPLRRLWMRLTHRDS